MALFSKPKTVIWPQAKSVDIYSDRKENNTITFDLDLWQPLADSQIEPLAFYLRQSGIKNITVLVSDDVVLTKSFIYDSKITQIDKKEVISLAESFINFQINPEYLDYDLIQRDDKTIIRDTIYDPPKFDNLKNNLAKLGINIESFLPVSAANSAILTSFYGEPYFLLYPHNNHEYTLSLSKGDTVYLSARLKGQSLDIQKIINYSHLYFITPVNKIFVPANHQVEIISNSELDKTQYDPIQIAGKFNLPTNLPLPVLGSFYHPTASKAAIINNNQAVNINSLPTTPMENKKNILPFVAVFIFTAAIASIVIWFVINRNSSNDDINNPSSDNQVPTIAIEETPTLMPSPTVAIDETAIKKNIKIQVLNATEINGQAATLKSMLTKLGFTSVAVGNSKEAATANQIQLKSTLADYGPYFQQKLESQFPGVVITSDLAATSTYDAVFIIGTDLSAAAAPAAETATPSVSAAPRVSGSPAPTE